MRLYLTRVVYILKESVISALLKKSTLDKHFYLSQNMYNTPQEKFHKHHRDVNELADLKKIMTTLTRTGSGILHLMNVCK